MFHHVGRKIRRISTIVFTVQAVASCIAGVVLWAVLVGKEADIQKFLLSFLIGAAVAAVGVLLAWLSQLLLQGYGKITEYCERELEKSEIK